MCHQAGECRRRSPERPGPARGGRVRPWWPRASIRSGAEEPHIARKLVEIELDAARDEIELGQRAREPGLGEVEQAFGPRRFQAASSASLFSVSARAAARAGPRRPPPSQSCAQRMASRIGRPCTAMMRCSRSPPSLEGSSGRRPRSPRGRASHLSAPPPPRRTRFRCRPRTIRRPRACRRAAARTRGCRPYRPAPARGEPASRSSHEVPMRFERRAAKAAETTMPCSLASFCA